MQELRYYDRVETVARAGFVTMKLTLNDATPASVVADEFYQLRKKLGDERMNLPQGVVGPIVNDEYSDVYFLLFALEAKGLPQRMLVDDAIIAIEMMVVKMEKSMGRVAAATNAWGATAAPMLSGTLMTIQGFLPVWFARSSAGEYAGNIFWVVGFTLIASCLVAVVFTP